MMLVDKYNGNMEKLTLQTLMYEMEELCSRYDVCRIDMPLIRKIYLEIEEFDKPMISQTAFENIIFESLCKQEMYDEAKSYIVMLVERDLAFDKLIKESKESKESKEQPTKKEHKFKLFKK